MEELYGKDRATREGADTASEIRARRVASTQQYSGSGSMINDIDDMTEQDEIQIEGFSSPGANETSPATVDVESGTTHANSSGAKRGKKGGKSKVDMELFFEKCEGMLSSGIEKLGRSINDIPLTPADEINRYGL
ncbi:unnamed protein product [Cuscuta epithymum]|nr:unnamed protein product [Cuscuta epithymum]